MFDPTYPPVHAEIESAPLRGQFNALKDLIDAVPGITGVAVDAVNTLPPGTPATVDLYLDGGVLHFTFSLPAGHDGAAGEVTFADMETALSAAISTTSANSNAVAMLDTPYADPDTEELRGKVNELIDALRR